MKKKDLSKEQLDERNLFVKVLEKSGWQATGVNKMFEDGDYVSEEAQMEYDNGKMNLLVEFSSKIAGIKLYLTANSGKEANFVIQYEDREEELLKLITSFQEKISADNFKKKISKILEKFPQTFADINDKGLHQLVEVEADKIDSKKKKKN